MSRSPVKRDSLRTYLFSPSRQAANIPFSKYRSPPLTPKLVPAKAQQRKEFEDLQVKPNVSHLELQVSILNTKLQQREIECLELRSTCAHLKAELTTIKDQIEEFKLEIALLTQENLSKDQEILKIREEIPQLEKSMASKPQEPECSLNSVEEYKLLIQEINYLEQNLTQISNENLKMKQDIQEVFKMKEMYKSLPHDIAIITIQVHKLSTMLDNFRKGDVLDIKLIHEGYNTNLVSEDVLKDCQKIKDDLVQILFMVAGLYEEQIENNKCVKHN